MKVSGFLVCFLSQTASLGVCLKAGIAMPPSSKLPSSKKEVLQIFFPALDDTALELVSHV